MTDDLDAFDAQIASQEVPEPKKERRTNIAIRDAIVNPDVAAELVKGTSITSLAIKLGVNPATIRKWMRRSEFKDLLSIEARRIMMHMSRRSLKDVRYKDLAQSLVTLLGEEGRQRNGKLDGDSGLISQTTIEQINVLVLGQRDGSQGEKNITGVTELAAREIPSLPEESEQSGTEEALGSPGGSSKP